ncbi:hypothetical protein SAMN04487914_13721 [Arthrobacter sp. ok909]|nr:hypothetical protein SAMN04487914_13721 [Arthrobacter sp. ok909]
MRLQAQQFPRKLLDIERRALLEALCLNSKLDRGASHPDIRLDIYINGRQQETARQHVQVSMPLWKILR